MGLWDVTFKMLLRQRPQDLLGLLPDVDPTRPLRLLDTGFAPPDAQPRMLDGCVEIATEPDNGPVYHVEFEAEPRSDTGARVFEHWALAQLSLRRPVRAVVFYLTPGSDGRTPQRTHRVGVGTGTSCEFRFEVLCLWELSAGQILRRPAPALWATVGLCRAARLGDVLRARRQVEQRVPDPRQRRELLSALLWLAGTRFLEEDLRRILPEELLMESSTYNATMERGRKEGRVEGRIEGLRLACLAILRARLGTLPEEAVKIDATNDPERLERLLVQLSELAKTDAAGARAALTDLDR